MAFSFLLNRDGVNLPDYRIKAGKIVLSTSADAARDRIYTALQTQLGEWFLDVERGVPYYGETGILGGKRTEAEVSALIRRVILRDPEVDRIISLDLIQDSFRNVNVTGEVFLSLADGTSETIQIEA